jgi:hypothetical protein
MHPKQPFLVRTIAAVGGGELRMLAANREEDRIQKARRVEPIHEVEDCSADNIFFERCLSIAIARKLVPWHQQL